MLIKKTFPKEERLNSKKLIDSLFNEGDSFVIYPFKVIYLKNDSAEKHPLQILITVSKRNIKQAVDRNEVKRLIREAYRLNKERLCQQLQARDQQLLIGLIYTDRNILPFAKIESKIILILQRLIEQDEQAVG